MRPHRHRRAIVMSATALTLLATAASADSIWRGPLGLGGSGSWHDPDHWSPNGVPGQFDDVFIDGGKFSPSNVSLTQFSASAGNLTIDANDILTIGNQHLFIIQHVNATTGDVVNRGTIRLNSAGGNAEIRPGGGL